LRLKITTFSLGFFSFFLFFIFLFWKGTDWEVIKLVRLPELLLAYGFGAVLGVVGVVYQGVLKNPLASPYILGVSAGAAFGATLGAFFSVSVTLGAVLGSFTSVFLLFIFSRFLRGSLEILLFGVGMNAFLSSLILFFYAVMPSSSVHDALFYTLGFISPISLSYSFLLFLLALVSLPVLLLFGRWIDALSMGEIGLFSGVRFEKEGVFLLLIGAFFVSFFVGIVGIVGFVGIVVPHVGRLLGFRSAKELLLVSFFIGGNLLLLSQFVARNILYPTVLPVGAVTALIGVPVFLYVLGKRNA